MPLLSKVLIVDDDEEIRDILEDTLSLYGYSVVTAATINEAEAAWQTLGFPAIGLVICDVHLTEDEEAQEGYRLCQHWKKRYPPLPFMLISGDLAMKELPAVRAGAAHFVAKPFALPEFLETVRRIFPSEDEALPS